MCDLAKTAVERLEKQGETLALAESCTGGAISASLVEVPGASAVFLGSFVVYALLAKEKWLGVDKGLLELYGAVSYEVAEALCQALLEKTEASLVGAVTGIAGPTGGSLQKPVGCVYVALCRRGAPVQVEKHLLKGSRLEIIYQTKSLVLQSLVTML